MGARGFKMFCQRGSDIYLLALCVWRREEERFSTSPSVKKKTTDPLPINK